MNDEYRHIHPIELLEHEELWSRPRTRPGKRLSWQDRWQIKTGHTVQQRKRWWNKRYGSF